MSVLAEIGTGCTKNRICVSWPGGFNKSRVELVRTIPGRSYVETFPKHWHVPHDMETCRLLRERFGDDLEIGPNLKAWAIGAARAETKMGSIANKETASLRRLPLVLPSLYEAIHLGPLGRYMTHDQRQDALLGPASYQAADVEFLAESAGPLNGNEQGTGKTIEWIAAIWEAGLEEGDHLIICPKTAADATWEPELEKWQAECLEQIGIFMCVQDSREERQEVIDRWLQSELPTRWVVVNPHMLMLRKDPHKRQRQKMYEKLRAKWQHENPGVRPDQEIMDFWNHESLEAFPLPTDAILAVKGKKADGACVCKKKKGPHEHYEDPFPELYEYVWRTVCVDEAHKGVVRNHRSLTFKSLVRLQVSDKKCCMSGTPMNKLGGADLWGMLHYLHPKVFSSYWQMADSFYEVTDNGFGKKVGLLREERQEAFFRMLSPYVLRRTKKECAPWLPEKMYVDVPVHMTPRQAQQYRAMEKESFTQVGVHEISASATVDKIVRLKQFANAHCKIDADGSLIPLQSPKIEAMLGKMEEIGVFEDKTKQQLVFSQSRRMCKLIYDTLVARGLVVGAIHGGTKGRRELKERFQAGDIQVMVIVTTAGGVSLTLDAADDVHLIDEMWNPGDDEQAEDRAHRVSRIHQVTVYIYRCLETIDEDIAVSKMEKKESHELILDVRRRIQQRLAA